MKILLYFFLITSFFSLTAQEHNHKDNAEHGKEGHVCKAGEKHEHEEVIEKDPNLQILQLVKDNDLNAIKNLLKQKMSIDIKTDKGITMLIAAVAFKNYEIADFLIKNKADVNITDSNGATALSAAAYSGDLKITKLLVENKANINITDKKGYTPLMIASAFGHFEIVKYLVDKKANLNTVDNSGYTPLTAALSRNKTDIFKYLLEKGAKSDLKDAIHPIFVAISVNNIEIIKLLVENKKVNVNLQNEKGVTPLILAANFNNKDIIQYLLKKKADKSLKDKNNKTAFDYAHQKKNKEIIELLQ